jgi:mono/diheme cytochrome c family protein/plastocyanin
MKMERLTRWLVIIILVGIPLGLLTYRNNWLHLKPKDSVTIVAKLPEAGGWTPENLQAVVGQPLHLHLTSEDVVHGFAIGQMDLPEIDVKPGEMTDVTVTFTLPGKYTFYCNRWCGPNHWRMRGTIEVSGEASSPTQLHSQPLYLDLGIDLDAAHPAAVVPTQRPSAQRGSELEKYIPFMDLSQHYLRSHSPAEIWEVLRKQSTFADLSDEQIWDLVALAWWQNTSPETLAEGQKLFSSNCAACHGQGGQGNGVFARQLSTTPDPQVMEGQALKTPANFSDPASMLGASPALLEGKIVRGGMGTGMPYWGPIFSADQLWVLVDYLWTFQFDGMDGTPPN